MAVKYVDNMPPIIVDMDAIMHHLDKDGVKTSMHVALDPVTKISTVSIYYDDGRGNGNCILSIPVMTLWDMVQ